jgi:hypothetical protein
VKKLEELKHDYKHRPIAFCLERFVLCSPRRITNVESRQPSHSTPTPLLRCACNSERVTVRCFLYAGEHHCFLNIGARPRIFGFDEAGRIGRGVGRTGEGGISSLWATCTSLGAKELLDNNYSICLESYRRRQVPLL